MINISILNGQFPDTLKVAKFIPIHKSGAQDDPANYMPISILSILSKIIEKHVKKHLFAYLNKYSLLHMSQSGFRKHHSCNTALINLIDRWLSNIEKGDILGAMFFSICAKFSMLLIIVCFLKNMLHINLAPHRKAGYNRTLQTENNVLSIKKLDPHFSLSKVVFHKDQFLVPFCSLIFRSLSKKHI